MIRIGVLGSANIATRSIIPAILELKEDFELVGVASRSLDKARELSQLHQLELFVGYDSILNKTLIDAVYIPLPNSLHYEWVKKSLESGLHVLVEKSLAFSLDEVHDLCQIARSESLALVENFQFRFHPQLEYIKNIISSGVIGDLRYIKSSFEFPPFKDADNIRYQKDLGGGALLDAGAYPIKVISLILGDSISVTSAFMSFDRDREIDIFGGGMLTDKTSQTFGLISYGFDNYYQCSLEVFGSLGLIKSDRIFTSPPGYSPTIFIKVNGESDKKIEIDQDNHFKRMLAHFSKVTCDSDLKLTELSQNITQARLLHEFKLQSND